MSDEFLLAIDCGTGSTRAVVFDREGGVVALAQREWTHKPEEGVPGSQRFDTDANWAAIASCIREVSAGRADRIVAASATSMREGMVLFDSEGEPIWACPNVDGRAGAEAAELVRSGAAEKIYDTGGDWVAITSPARFRWLAAHRPEILAAAEGVGMLGDWVAQRLSGVLVTDPTLGSSSGMFDLAARSWSDELVELLDLRRSMFPEVLEPGTVIGGVTARAAEQTGLRAGTPVVVGGADTQLGLLGAGITEPGQVTIIGGSFWQQTAVTDEPLIDPKRRLRTLCHAPDGRWMIEGIGFYCGLAMRWFRDAFCSDEVARAAAEGRDPYELLEEAAQTVAPGSGGVFAVMSNLMEARHWVHAAPAFVGFDIDNPQASGKKECFRAIEEAAAYVSRGHLEIIEEVTGLAADAVRFAGGASKGTLWPQILADVLDRPVVIPTVRESTALGAAVCAGVGAHWYENLDAGRALASDAARFEPDSERAAAYAGLYGDWLALYDDCLQLTDSGVVRPLWRAAGT